MSSADLVILSNAPGELTTWVYPVLRELEARFAANPSLPPLRISVVLSPDSNASGNEAAIAASFPGVARVLPPEAFQQFLLWGQTPSWDWHQRGVVLFLGGDQIFPVAIGKHLGYATLIYAEWEARWLNWVDRFALRHESMLRKIPPRFLSKVMVVGDLMVSRADIGADNSAVDNTIVFLPGSKPMKLQQGVPLCLGIADRLRAAMPHLQFAIALAPTLTPEILAKFAQPHPVVDLVQGTTAIAVPPDDHHPHYRLRTPAGTEIDIDPAFPAHDLLRRSQLCVTTAGANTAELAALAVPMVVLLPTNQLDAMRAWDGIWGILANLPVVGDAIAKLINRIVFSQLLRRQKLFAWANIWAGEEIVPELLGHLTPAIVADRMLALLRHPQELQCMRDRLRAVCGQPGADRRIVDLLLELLELRSRR